MEPLEIIKKEGNERRSAASLSPSSSISGGLSDDSSEKTTVYPFQGSAEDTFIQVRLLSR